MYCRLLCITLTYFICGHLISQDCHITLSGTVTDKGTGLALQGVNIYIQEINTGTTTDAAGSFILEDLCHNDYHIVYSHIGCASFDSYLHLHEDTTVVIQLEHSTHVLDGVVVTGQTSPRSAQSTQVINQQNISDQANQNLSNILESISGVSTLRNGNAIAKPIVH